MYSQNQGAAAQFPTLSCTIPVVCEVTAIARCSSPQAQTVVPTLPPFCGTLPPSVVCHGNSGAQAQTIMPTLPTMCGILPPSIGCHGNSGAQAQTVMPTLLPPMCGILPPSIGCHGNSGAQAQFPTLNCTIPVVCAVTAIAKCGDAQAQTIIPTQVPGSCGILPPSIGCHGNSDAQAQFPTLNCTLPVVCEVTAIARCNDAQAQTMVTVGPNCTGIYTNACGDNANAQTVLTAPPHCGGVHTLATVCTQTVDPNCTVTTTIQPTTSVAPSHITTCVETMLGCPVTVDCPPHGGAQNVGQTGWYTCGQSTVTTTVQPTFNCPPHQGSTVTTTVQPTNVACYGPTGTQGCTSALGCPSTSTCPPNAGAQNVGQTGWYTCGQPTVTTTVQTANVDCFGPTGTQGCTSALGCPSTSTCPPNADAQTIGFTGWYTCGQSTVTTTVQPTHVTCVGPTGTEGCTSALGCPSTSTCPPNTGSAEVAASHVVTGCNGQGCTMANSCPADAGAHAQLPTVECTLSPVVCVATKVAGCSSGFPTEHCTHGCTGIPIVC